MHIPIEKKKEIITRLFEYIKDKWEVYMPLDGGSRFIILKTVCSKCGTDWYVDEKECFLCKTRYIRAIRCLNCKKIVAEENMQHCPHCGKKPGSRRCLNCGKNNDGQFVPITFCSKCGNRENKFEYKIIEL